VRTAGGNRVRRSTPLSGRELDGGGDRSLPEPLRRAQRFGLTPDVHHGCVSLVVPYVRPA